MNPHLFLSPLFLRTSCFNDNPMFLHLSVWFSTSESCVSSFFAWDPSELNLLYWCTSSTFSGAPASSISFLVATPSALVSGFAAVSLFHRKLIFFINNFFNKLQNEIAENWILPSCSNWKQLHLIFKLNLLIIYYVHLF